MPVSAFSARLLLFNDALLCALCPLGLPGAALGVALVPLSNFKSRVDASKRVKLCLRARCGSWIPRARVPRAPLPKCHEKNIKKTPGKKDRTLAWEDTNVFCGHCRNSTFDHGRVTQASCLVLALCASHGQITCNCNDNNAAQCL